jgi:hypothetical protein
MFSAACRQSSALARRTTTFRRAPPHLAGWNDVMLVEDNAELLSAS